MRLIFDALIKFIIGFVFVAGILFLSAGTLDYFGGWLFIGLLFMPVFIMGIVLFLKAPVLLEKRLNGKEKVDTEKAIIVFSSLMFLGGFITAGIDFRFGWSSVPKTVTVTASVLFLFSYCIYAEVLRENEYLFRTIEVQENQKVIDTGLYGIVRHPMYTATILMFLTIPFILGSWWSCLFFLIYPMLIMARIKNEEEILSEELDGYLEYKQKVKYRILPFIW